MLETNLVNCVKGNHPLRVIFSVGRSCESSVVRWCPKCGCVVVDTDYDGRTKAGDIVTMKIPELFTSFKED